MRLSVVLAMARKHAGLEFAPQPSLVCRTMPEIKAAVNNICDLTIEKNKQKRVIAKSRKARAEIARNERLRRTRNIVEEGHRFIGTHFAQYERCWLRSLRRAKFPRQ